MARPTSKLLRTILAGFAEYEREVIRERINAGVKRAKSQGKRWGGGRPGARPTLTTKKLRAIKTLLASGERKAVIARELGIARSSVYRAVKLLET